MGPVQKRVYKGGRDPKKKEEERVRERVTGAPFHLNVFSFAQRTHSVIDDLSTITGFQSGLPASVLAA